MRALMAKPSDRLQGWGPAVLRLVLGIVFAVHGAQKLFGSGIPGVARFFSAQAIPLPEVFAPVVTFVELVGGIALVLGVLTRLAGIALAIDMLVATLVVHLPNGFFISRGGLEFTLVLMAACLALALSGPGELSVDRLIWGRRQRRPQISRSPGYPWFYGVTLVVLNAVLLAGLLSWA